MSVGAATGGNERAVALPKAIRESPSRRIDPAPRDTVSDPAWSAPNAAFAGKSISAIPSRASPSRPPIPSTEGPAAESVAARLPPICRSALRPDARRHSRSDFRSDRTAAQVRLEGDKIRRSDCPAASLVGVSGALGRTHSGARPKFIKTVKLRIRTADRAPGLRTCRSWIGSAGRKPRAGTMVALGLAVGPAERVPSWLGTRDPQPILHWAGTRSLE